MSEFKGNYGESLKGNFVVVDSIGAPHPYRIGAKHVGHAADHFGGMLGRDAIEDGERRGIYCCTCKGQLKYDEHEQVLLVECRADPQTDEDAREELTQYLLAIKDEAENNGYAGFVFMKV